MINSESLKRVIMGLDISTKTVGLTIATWDEKSEMPNILIVTHLRPRHIANAKNDTEKLFMKSDIICKNLAEYVKYGITDIIIEEPQIGTNNARTAASLLRFNGMISQSVYNIFKVVPEFITSYEARKYGCPQLMAVRKYKKDGSLYTKDKIIENIEANKLSLFGEFPFDCEKKHILWNIVSDMFPDIQWYYNSRYELRDENFDASDSLVCVLGYIGRALHGECSANIKEHSVTDNKISYTVDFCGKEYPKAIMFDTHNQTLPS